ncbi:MAG: protein kinase [Phycisphaerales bacterium]|nr:protein kinase [Phycisphaerales bacterium]
MDRGLFQRAEAAVLEALELDAPTRARFLTDLRSRDPELATHVEHLVSLDDDSRRAFATRASDGEPLDDLVDDPLVGKDLADYHLIRIVGIGGMGRVYEARQRFPARRVAVKVIGSRLFPSRIARRFRQEAQILGALEHPGICRVIEAGIATVGVDSVPFLAMEYVDGVRLDHAALGMTIPARIACMAEICEAVGYAHRQGVFHRDLKPGNILVQHPHAAGASPRAKVLDFGVARAINDNSDPWTLTATGQPIGTPRYMSPQQAAGQETDASADVFSLGVMLAELLTPTRSGEPMARLAPPSRELSLSVPTDLRTIISKATEFDPARRYPTADELGDDLRRHIEGRPILARRPTLAYRTSRFIARNRILTAAIALGLISVVAIGGALWNRSSAVASRRMIESLSQQGRFAEYISLIQQTYGDIEAEDISAARDRLAQAPTDLRGWEWDFLNRISDLSFAAWDLPTSLAGQSITGFAIDGPGFIVGFGETTVRVQQDRPIPSIGNRNAFAHLAWSADPRRAQSPDGSLLAIAGPDGIKLTASQPSQPIPTLVNVPKNVRCIAFLPDEPLRLAAASTAVIAIWDVSSGKRIGHLRGHTAPVTGITAADGQIWTIAEDHAIRCWNPVLSYADADEIPLEGITVYHPCTVIGRHDPASATFHLIDFTTDTPIVSIKGHSRAPTRFTYTTDHRYAAMAGPNTGAAIVCYSIPEGTEIARRENMLNEDSLFDINPASGHLVAGGESGIVRIMSLPDLKDVFTFDTGRVIHTGAVSPDGKLVVLIDQSYASATYRLSDGGKVAEIQTRSAEAVYPNFSDDSSMVFALNMRENNINLWDAYSGELLRRVIITAGPMGFAKLPGTGRVAVGCVDGTIQIYPVDRGMVSGASAAAPWLPTLYLRNGAETVHMLGVTRDGRSLMGWMKSAPTMVWNAGKPPRSLGSESTIHNPAPQ